MIIISIIVRVRCTREKEKKEEERKLIKCKHTKVASTFVSTSTPSGYGTLINILIPRKKRKRGKRKRREGSQRIKGEGRI